MENSKKYVNHIIYSVQLVNLRNTEWFNIDTSTSVIHVISLKKREREKTTKDYQN